MKYSPLAVHCASLCLDIVLDDSFHHLSESNIYEFYQDVYDLVFCRVYEAHMTMEESSALSLTVTNRVMALLCYLTIHPTDIDSGRILFELDDAIQSHQSS